MIPHHTLVSRRHNQFVAKPLFRSPFGLASVTKKLLVTATLTLSCLSAIHNASAVTILYTRTTDNTGAPDSWNAATNWNTKPISATDTILDFGGTYNTASSTTAVSPHIFTNNDIVDGFSLNKIQFSGITSNVSQTTSLTISGGQLNFSSGGQIVNSGGTNLGRIIYTISNNINVGTTGTFSLNSFNGLNFTLSGSLSGSATITKAGGAGVTISNASSPWTGAYQNTAGNTLVSGILTATSSVTVSGGTFTLGAANRINDAATITMSGGTFATGGFSETVGALTLTSSTTSGLDLGAGASIVLFSGITNNTGTLAITNYTSGSDSLRFTDNTNLNASSFTINGGAASIVNQGSYYEVVAVPEPGVWSLLPLAAGLLASRSRIKRLLTTRRKGAVCR